MTDNITERIRRLRKDTMEIAQDSLDHDLRAYHVLTDVAIRLTDIIKQSGVTESTVIKGRPSSLASEADAITGDESVSSRTTVIYARYKGVYYQAQLDSYRISIGVEECVYYEGDWRTASGAAMRVARSNVNGWNFWRYKRDNGSEGRIAELKTNS